MKKLFHLKEHGTSVPTEIRAGLTTFFAMAYIIFVNPVFLSATGMDVDGAMIATCLGAAIGCLMTALLSNKPFAMAPGMGMNAFFAYTLCLGYGYTWQQALALVFLSGLLFLAAVAAFGEKTAELIPASLKHAITVGIGILLMLIGLFDAGIIDVSAGVPALADLGSPGVQIALAGLLITIVLTALRVPGSLILGMIATAVISLLCGTSQLPDHALMLPTALSKVFLKLDFHGLLRGNTMISSVVSLAALILTMTVVDMFDTIGYLVGTGSCAGLMDKQGNMNGMRRVMLADACSTVLGSLCGTSTVTVYAESTAGIVAGGKTGLTGIVTGVCFLLCLFLSPLAGMMSAAVTAPALIVVGMYLVMDLKNLELNDMSDAIPALLTIVLIPMTYSITAGLGIGFLTYVVCSLCTRRRKNLTPGVMILAGIFLLYFILA